MDIEFEWDDAKAASNRVKHGISFELAARAFADPRMRSWPDKIEDGELRWRTVGMVEGCLVVLVVHLLAESADSELIRIISARRATAKERRSYEQNNPVSY